MRMHARSLVALARTRDELVELAAPSPGLFRSHLRDGDVVRGGAVVGELEILGQLVAVIAPDTAGGRIVESPRDLARAPVDHGGTLFTLDPRALGGGDDVARGATTSAAAAGLVFRAPTSGRFYGRPSPDKPAFVSAGAELEAGVTICLLEVMKTFHRVTYGGGGLPERARVRELLVADGADVNAGDALLALDAL